MCGIFGYIGPKEAGSKVIEGLKKLEYRGYDSAGLAGLASGKIYIYKEAGKICKLEHEVHDNPIAFHTSIGHTRWATHGKPTKINAHPHLDQTESFALVHNGIIENYEALKKALQAEGIQFRSETDSEVIVQIISKFYKGNLLEAVKLTLPLLKGAFAFALIHKDHPEEILAVGHEAPLVIGVAPGEIYLASDAHSLAAHTKEVIFLNHSEIAILRKDKVEIYDHQLTKLNQEFKKLSIESEETSKGKFDHFTLKEIFEQPSSLRRALLSRFNEDFGTAIFDNLQIDNSELLKTERILILGCGTSWNAGYVASYFLEELARLPTQVEISSEFRYKNPIISSNTLVIAISQSGETADTLAAVRELKAKGVKVLGICNVENSSLSRLADGIIYLQAGPEIGVCSTKAFTSQVSVLFLFTLMMARMRNMSKQDGLKYLEALKRLPDQVEKVLGSAAHIESIARKFAKFENFFFIGRNYLFPTCLEGALKLKEISYINANGYPAGELKHGSIALISPETPTVALTCNQATLNKTLSNLQEIKARGGQVIGICDEAFTSRNQVDDVISIPGTLDPLAPILSAVACQLFAYYVARERGCDIDQPRNLAKSVTVE